MTPLAHTRRGSGEPLVLIHGIGHRRQAWEPVLELLAAHHDVIAVDLPGFGESAPHPAGIPYSMDVACRTLAENFEHWGIERPHVVGNSLGGAIALELGARDLVRSVTALSPAGFFRRLDRARAFALLFSLRLTAQLPTSVIRRVTSTAAGRRLTGSLLYVHPDRFTAAQVYGDALALRRAPAFEGTIRAGARYAFAGRVSVPTTVAWGTRDRILPFAQSAVAQERLPEARHVALAHCGHVPMIDDPQLVARVIEQTTLLADRGA